MKPGDLVVARIPSGWMDYDSVDGQPQWVWVAEEDMELLVNDPPTN